MTERLERLRTATVMIEVQQCSDFRLHLIILGVLVARGTLNVERRWKRKGSSSNEAKAPSQSTIIDLSPFHRISVLIVYQSIVCSTCIFPMPSYTNWEIIFASSTLPYSNRMPALYAPWHRLYSTNAMGISLNNLESKETL